MLKTDLFFEFLIREIYSNTKLQISHLTSNISKQYVYKDCPLKLPWIFTPNHLPTTTKIQYSHFSQVRQNADISFIMLPSNFSNMTLHGIQNAALHDTWIGYHIFILIASLLGDSTILIASIKYRALKLNKLIVVIINHIAVCNLLVAVTTVLPRAVSLITQQWVFGEGLCYLLSYTHNYFHTVSVLLVCDMTTTKLFVLKFPLKTRFLSVWHCHVSCAAVWISASFFMLLFLVEDKDNVRFDYRSYGCDYLFTSPTWAWLMPLKITLTMIIPNLVVVTCTVVVLLHLIQANRLSQKIGRYPRYQGIITAVLTAVVYSILYLPYAIYRLGQDHVPLSNTHFHLHFYRLAVSLTYLNTLSNFFVPSFRTFVWSRLTLVVQKWREFNSNLKLLEDYLQYF